MDYLWVGIGGFVGANARHVLGTWIISRVGSAFPWHTLIVNVTGSLLIGLILVLVTDRLHLDAAWRLLLVVGFLGGYTTFSSYSFEAVSLLERGEWSAGLVYLVASNGLCLAATTAGILVARSIGR